MTALIDKAMSPKVISNYAELLKTFKNQFITNISEEEILKFIKMQLNDMSSLEYTYSYKNKKLCDDTW